MRKRQAIKRDVLPDPIYGSKVIMKLINAIMLDGKKGKAQTIFYKALDLLKEKTHEDAFESFNKALNYQVPIEVTKARSEALAIRWLVKYSRLRKGHSMAENLANELYDAINETGQAFKKKEDTHRMAEANKAFAHYRW